MHELVIGRDGTVLLLLFLSHSLFVPLQEYHC